MFCGVTDKAMADRMRDRVDDGFDDRNRYHFGGSGSVSGGQHVVGLLPHGDVGCERRAASDSG